jgi:hypothetical protein
MDEELFYCLEMKTQYQSLIISYNSLIENYQRIIENNENFMRKLSLNTKYMETDNQIFRCYVYEYKNMVYGLEIYMRSLDERILDLTPPPPTEIIKERSCLCKNS